MRRIDVCGNFAIERGDRWVASTGVEMSDHSIVSATFSSSMLRGRPGRGSSATPSIRHLTKHLPHAWVFPSEACRVSETCRVGHFVKLRYSQQRISEGGGAKFRFDWMRYCFITVAERDLLLSHSLTNRLVNHTPLTCE